MTRAEADQLVATLRAAFPYPSWPEATVALYVHELTGLDDAEAAREAVRLIVENESRWPPVSELRRAYRAAVRRRAAERASARGLEAEHLPSAENLRRVRELRERLDER